MGQDESKENRKIGNYSKLHSSIISQDYRVLVRGSQSSGKTTFCRMISGLDDQVTLQNNRCINTYKAVWPTRSGKEMVNCLISDVNDFAYTNKLLEKEKQQGITRLKISHNQKRKEIDLSDWNKKLFSHCDGCVFIFNVCEQFTWDYVVKYVPFVSRNLKVLIIGNAIDRSDRIISQKKISAFVDKMKKEMYDIHYFECSLQFGYGLEPICYWFLMPLLSKKVSRYQMRKEKCESEYEKAVLEFKLLKHEESYKNHLSSIEKKQQIIQQKKHYLKNSLFNDDQENSSSIQNQSVIPNEQKVNPQISRIEKENQPKVNVIEDQNNLITQETKKQEESVKRNEHNIEKIIKKRKQKQQKQIKENEDKDKGEMEKGRGEGKQTKEEKTIIVTDLIDLSGSEQEDFKVEPNLPTKKKKHIERNVKKIKKSHHKHPKKNHHNHPKKSHHKHPKKSETINPEVYKPMLQNEKKEYEDFFSSPKKKKIINKSSHTHKHRHKHRKKHIRGHIHKHMHKHNDRDKHTHKNTNENTNNQN
ncbi:ras gtpase-related [Anaeramoeba flamelloides]|uniref:Ras gtpase-related n=1 Tax=Anaeramoeba flamelloides TaxID=1746091 RepID=A0AAV8A822_9EUKA|nr:ras gtpase-related [Anaeramoeba flamelloides]